MATVVWRKSSYSTTNGGSCVEVAEPEDNAVWIRDSKLGDRSPIFKVTRAQFRAFVEFAKTTH